MSGQGGPLPCATPLLDEASAAQDAAEGERMAIARRIGAIAAACQREAAGGMVPLSLVEVRLVALADDVRAGIHGGGA